jgi:hypothetical protein
MRKEKELKKLPLEIYIDLALLYVARDKPNADIQNIDDQIRECWKALDLQPTNVV